MAKKRKPSANPPSIPTPSANPPPSIPVSPIVESPSSTTPSANLPSIPLPPSMTEQLRELRLPAIRDHFSSQAERAARENLSYPQYLESLTRLERAELPAGNREGGEDPRIRRAGPGESEVTGREF